MTAKQLTSILISIIFFANQVSAGPSATRPSEGADQSAQDIIVNVSLDRDYSQESEGTPSPGASLPTIPAADPAWNIVASSEKTPVNPVEPGKMQVPLKCKGTVLDTCVYRATMKDIQAKSKEVNSFKGTTCSTASLDSSVASSAMAFQPDILAQGASSSGTSQANAMTGTAGQAGALAFKDKCTPIEATLEAELEAINKTIEQDYGKCKQQVNTAAQQCYQQEYNKALAANAGNPGAPAIASAAGEAARGQFIAENMAAIEKPKTEAESWVDDTLAFLKEHWGKILLGLAALGAGLMALNSSGDKQKKDFQTNPEGTNNENKAEDSAKGPDSGDATAASATPQSNTNVQNSAGQAYCQTANQPLECFVTPACDLKCVAEKYGVSQYAGMDKDTTRIDPNGKPIDGASSTGGSGSSGSSSLGDSSSGGNKSGSSGANLNASSEVGSTNDSSGAVTRASSSYDDGIDGYGGGGFGSRSSDRDPANDRYKGQGQFGGKAVAAKDPAATGPLHPPTTDLFQRITNVSRTQCVRELVLCNKK